MTESRLLPPNALNGVSLGISVSESADLSRLGLLEIHFRLALAEIARCVLLSAGALAYGGHLRANGYTSFLVRELERYQRRDKPLAIYLAWTEHRQMLSETLRDQRRSLGLFGEITLLDLDGNIVGPVEAPPVLVFTQEERERSLNSLRRVMTRRTHGRILFGGKRNQYQGSMPGVMEEALLSIREGKPIYLAGGFGGITLDIAQELGVDDGKWLPRSSEDEPDAHAREGMAQLIRSAKETNFKSLDNGLTREENARLAACHRPSEIATLVSVGLSRKFAQKR